MAEPGAADFLSPEVVAAVMRHMNDDHAGDNVVICRGVGGRPATTAAAMTGLDHEAIEFLADCAAGAETVRIPFSTRLVDRAQIRAEVARMFHESEAMLDPA